MTGKDVFHALKSTHALTDSDAKTANMTERERERKRKIKLKRLKINTIKINGSKAI